MAIEVRIPKEITEYKEKILFGLNIRQLLCFSAAIVLGTGSYYLISKYLGTEVASYVVIFEVLPIFALGFFKKDGFNFERYVALILRHKLGRSRRNYVTELYITRLLEGSEVEKNAKPTKKKKKPKRNREKRESEAGNIFFEQTKAKRKAKSKTIKRSIKAARKEYQIAKRQIKKGIEKKEVTTNSSTID